jgi:acyl carrier protein
MDEKEIYARLADVFESIFDDQSIELTPVLSAKDIDGWDSLTNIRLMLTVEKGFKMKFSASDIAKLQNVGDLVALIRARA